MGAFADSLFAVLMSWVRALVNGLWALFSSEKTTALEFLGKNWLLIVIVLVAAGLAIDWIIWMIRWKPYALRGRIREARRKEEEEEIDRLSQEMFSDDVYEADADESPEDDFFGDADDDWLPERPVMDEADVQQAIERAESVPDEELGVYPGMRYDEQAQPVAAEEVSGGTRKYAAVHQEGPGAAEVSRRRAEIDAWQLQMQEEARAERMRQLEEKRRAEEAKRAEEARLIEEARLAEEARMAEQARLAEEQEEARRAQEEYQRQLEEYERQKAQYEREMAQYQRELAAYEAAVAQQQTDAEAAQEIAPESEARQGRSRRRVTTYSDMVQGEAVEELPGTPAWPKMGETVSSVKKSASAAERTTKNSGFMGRMAHLIEPEQEEISGVQALPPRVDPNDAYKPAAKPGQTRKRIRK